MLPDGTLRVTAPAGVDVRPYISLHAGWIETKRAHLERISSEYRDWEDRFLFRGVPCHLVPGDCCRFDPGKREVRYRSPAALRKTLTAWLRADLDRHLHEAGEAMGVSWRRTAIRMQRTRWGSCSSKGTLSFNLRLSALPDDLRRYVVVHELAHLARPDHSAAFWDLVSAHHPGYRDAEADLKRFWVILERNVPWRTIGQE